MGELSLHVTVRDGRPLSAPFTLTASVPGLERWDKPAYIQHTMLRIIHTHMCMYMYVLYVV